MPSPVVNMPVGYGRCSQVFSVAGTSKTPVVTYGFVDDPAETPNTIAQSRNAEWLAQFVPASLASTWALKETNVTIHRAGGQFVGSYAVLSQGAAGFNAMSMAVSAILRKFTAVGGRRGRGRCYLPAGYLGELSVDPAGVIDPALVTATANRWSAIIAAMTGSSEDMVLLHAAIPPAVGGAPTVVLAGTCENMAATQRRRQR